MNALTSLGKIGIWIGIATIAYLGILGGIGGAQYANLERPELLVALSAIPLILASHLWRQPLYVAILATGLAIPTTSGILASNFDAPTWPFLVVLIAIDFLAIRYSFQRQRVESRTIDLEAMADIVRMVGNGAAYGQIADRLNVTSQHLIGVGRTRFWLVDSAQGEINLIPTGDAAVMARLPGQNKYSGQRLSYPLDSTLVSARAATSGEVVEVADLLGSGPELLLSRQQAEFDGYRTILALPLFHRGQVAGVLSFESSQRQQKVFSKPERLNLRSLAALATLAINEVANREA